MVLKQIALVFALLVSHQFGTAVDVKALTIVSLGDSYASGEGNPDEPQRYDALGMVKKGPVWTDRQCHRSHIAAPEIAANAIALLEKQSLNFIGLACTGARISDGLLHSYDPDTDDISNPVPSQVETLKSRIGSQAIDIVFMSVGGNDIGFANLIKDCIKIDLTARLGQGKGCSKNSTIANLVHAQLAMLPHQYDGLADRLKTLKIGKVFITEYPDPTKGQNNEYCGERGNDPILYLLPDTAKWAYEDVLIPLNAAIGAAADKHGWIRVPVMARSSRNGYCAKDSRWFRTEEDARNIQGPWELGLSPNDVLSPGFKFSLGSVHPNPEGHKGTADAIVGTYELSKDPSAAPIIKNRHPRFVADVNGDGRADIIGFATSEVRVSLGKPDGTFDPSKSALGDFAEQAGGWSVDRHPRVVGDVNGDGRADIIGFATSEVLVSLGQADGTFGPSKRVLADFTEQSGGWNMLQHPRIVGDVNGDGRADIVGFATSDVIVALGQADGTFSVPKKVLADFTVATGWQ